MKTPTQIRSNTSTHGWFNKQAEQFENARFGWMALLLTAQSCLGSIACGFLLQNDSNILWLCVSASITMGCNALLIALAPPKICLITFYLSILLLVIGSHHGNSI